MTAEYLRPGVAAANVKDGTLDGFFLIGGVPVPAIRELAATTPIRLIPIDDDALSRMKESSNSYRRSVIPAGTYPGIDTETPSIGFNALWIVSAEASDDLIYAITKALWNEATRRLLDAHNQIGKQVRVEDALGCSAAHRGRWFWETGLPVEMMCPSVRAIKV
jgi:TRAP transporter TAXI family solute receptor